MHKTQSHFNGLRQCEVCEKEMSYSSRLRHIKTNTHKHNEKCGIVIEENEFIETKNVGKDFMLEDVIEDCRNNFFVLLNKEVYMILTL